MKCANAPRRLSNPCPWATDQVEHLKLCQFSRTWLKMAKTNIKCESKLATSKTCMCAEECRSSLETKTHYPPSYPLCTWMCNSDGKCILPSWEDLKLKLFRHRCALQCTFEHNCKDGMVPHYKRDFPQRHHILRRLSQQSRRLKRLQKVDCEWVCICMYVPTS